MSSDEGFAPPWTKATAKSETYYGNCHCGAIRFKFSVSPPLYATDDPTDGQNEVVRCNCSICLRNGSISVYPFHKDVEWIGESEKNFKKYLFSSKMAPHIFCGTCGSSIGPDLTAFSAMFGEEPRWGINCRMIKDIDLARLKYADNRGADIPPAYKSPV